MFTVSYQITVFPNQDYLYFPMLLVSHIFYARSVYIYFKRYRTILSKILYRKCIGFYFHYKIYEIISD